ncbi:nitroreductase [Thermoanaerobacter mathranii subsp. mathranii str. A3]|uniref:Nitroreductase n=2 Tax=Thermoanaerobacter TaxID=1754 RepID=A0ABT9M189_9THEO|nr:MULTISPECIES: nitroreductase family protein [Thermoanaerobacter]ADH60248.1 nitroreductase [Thermoanaerobacter mathranii subsp. mathranii str. A3]MDP9749878.1 nitroreductase [Thermoanaerobacter pentosaceus]
MWDNLYDVRDKFCSRKSVRNYLNVSLDQDVIKVLMEIGYSGPVSGGLRCVFIKEVSNSEEKYICYKGTYYQKHVLRAPHIFLIGCNDSIIEEKYNGEFVNIFSCQNSVIAAQNIIIAAHEMGIGTCFVGAIRKDVIIDGLKLDKGYNPWCILCLGIGRDDNIGI